MLPKLTENIVAQNNVVTIKDRNKLSNVAQKYIILSFLGQTAIVCLM